MTSSDAAGSQPGPAGRGLVKQMIRGAARWLPLGLVERVAAVWLLTPYYHVVSDVPAAYLPRSYRVRTVAEFERELDWLLRRYVPVGLDALLAATRGRGELPGKALFLSFDDGYREVAEMVAPVLRRKGVPATFFLVSSVIDNREWCFEDQKALIRRRLDQSTRAEQLAAEAVAAEHGFTLGAWAAARTPQPELADAVGRLLGIDWRRELGAQQPYVSSDQVRGLLKDGFSIGSHSIDHRVYERLMFDEQLRQTRVSTDAICEQFDVTYRAFSFPYGDFGVSRAFFERVVGDGIVDVCFGTRGFIEDEFGLRSVQRLWCEQEECAIEEHFRRHLAEKIIRRAAGTDRVVRHN